MFDLVEYFLGRGKGYAEGQSDGYASGLAAGIAQEYARIWEKIGEDEFTVSTDSTTAAAVGTITIDENVTDQDLVYVHVRDKEGKRAERFYGVDAFIMPVALANGNTGSDNRIMYGVVHVKSDGTYGMNYTPNGVYPSAWNPSAKTVTIQSKYSASYTLTIDSTYVVEVYRLTLPNGEILFESGDD